MSGQANRASHVGAIPGVLFTSIVSYAPRIKKGKSRLKLGDRLEKEGGST